MIKYNKIKGISYLRSHRASSSRILSAGNLWISPFADATKRAITEAGTILFSTV